MAINLIRNFSNSIWDISKYWLFRKAACHNIWCLRTLPSVDAIQIRLVQRTKVLIRVGPIYVHVGFGFESWWNAASRCSWVQACRLIPWMNTRTILIIKWICCRKVTSPSSSSYLQKWSAWSSFDGSTSESVLAVLTGQTQTLYIGTIGMRDWKTAGTCQLNQVGVSQDIYQATLAFCTRSLMEERLDVIVTCVCVYLYAHSYPPQWQAYLSLYASYASRTLPLYCHTDFPFWTCFYWLPTMRTGRRRVSGRRRIS